MPSFFEKNLYVLQQRYPQAARILQQIAHYPPAPCEPSSSGVPNIPQPAEQIVLLGVGYDDLLLRLWNTLQPRHFVIIEKEFHTLYHIFHQFDLTSLLTDHHVFWVFAASRHELEPQIEYVKTSLAAHGFQLVKNPSIPPQDQPYYAMIHQELKRIIERESFHLKARLSRGPMIQRNLITNLPLLVHSYSLDTVINLFPNIPAIITAAGPSLDHNVHELKNASSKALILSVDTAVRTLHNHGIEPHIVVTSDPSPENAKHLQDIKIPSHTAFAFSADTYYTIPKQYAHLPHRIGILDNSSRLSYWVREHGGYHTLMERPLHVAETAIRLALLMGCNPILFTGLDLALTHSQGKTHSQGSALSSSIQSLTEKEAIITSPEGHSVKHAITHVQDYQGNPIPTLYSFKVYLERLHSLIEETPHIDWIDATEGGAKIEGTRSATLHEVLDSLPTKNEFFMQRLENLTPHSNLFLKKMIYDVQEGVSELQKLQEKIARIVYHEFNEQKARNLWEDFLGKKAIRAFLDHAVFSFQLEPPIERIAQHQRKDFLITRLTKVHEILQMFFPLWQQGLQELSDHA